MKVKKQILSALSIIAFFLIAIASSVNKIQSNAFSGDVRTEEKSSTNYLELNDGSRVTGKNISWSTGAFSKDVISIDDKRFKLSEVRGYMRDGTYFKRNGNGFMVRLVRGKLNVYRDSYETTTTTTDVNGRMKTRTISHYVHYVQNGQDGSMTTVTNQEDIKKIVSDCPLSVELASLSDKQMRKAIKSNKRYLNEIFEIYNNDCKPLQ